MAPSFFFCRRQNRLAEIPLFSTSVSSRSAASLRLFLDSPNSYCYYVERLGQLLLT